MKKIKNPLETFLVVATIILELTLLVEIGLIGKNVTYTTRFTPPSTQRSLMNETYFTQSQVFILLFSSLLVLLVPSLVYSIFVKSKRYFVPLWVAFMVVTALLMLASVYFLSGSQLYRSYLSQVGRSISSSPGYCEESLCNKVSCVRVDTYRDSRRMVIAGCVIDLICSVYIVAAGFLINRRRRKNNEIELIM